MPKNTFRCFIAVLPTISVIMAFAPEPVLAMRRHGSGQVPRYGNRHTGQRNIAARRGHHEGRCNIGYRSRVSSYG